MISTGPTLDNPFIAQGPECDSDTAFSSMAPCTEAEMLRRLIRKFFIRSGPDPGSKLTVLPKQASKWQDLFESANSFLIAGGDSWLPPISLHASSTSLCWESSNMLVGSDKTSSPLMLDLTAASVSSVSVTLSLASRRAWMSIILASGESVFRGNFRTLSGSRWKEFCVLLCCELNEDTAVDVASEKRSPSASMCDGCDWEMKIVALTPISEQVSWTTEFAPWTERVSFESRIGLSGVTLDGKEFSTHLRGLDLLMHDDSWSVRVKLQLGILSDPCRNSPEWTEGNPEAASSVNGRDFLPPLIDISASPSPFNTVLVVPLAYLSNDDACEIAGTSEST